MALKVIGPGFGRTGTNSLRVALNELGLGPTHHMYEISNHPEQMPPWLDVARGAAPDWDAMFAGYNSQVDWPGARYWRELMAYYPDSRIILSTRDPDKWFDSVSKTIAPLIAGRGTHDEAILNEISELANLIVNEQTFRGKLEERSVATKVFRDHVDEVTATVPASRLLVWQASEGWEPLCRFLDLPVPSTPFPDTNNAEDFNNRDIEVR